MHSLFTAVNPFIMNQNEYCAHQDKRADTENEKHADNAVGADSTERLMLAAEGLPDKLGIIKRVGIIGRVRVRPSYYRNY